MNALDAEAEAELERLLATLDTELEAEDAAAARVSLARALELAGPDHPDVVLGEAGLAWLEHGPDAAAELLERVIALDPAHADAHYALACSAEERGMVPLAIEHNLHVLRL